MRQPIIMLDSGVGGLTVVKEMFRQLPYEQIIYYGDTKRAPYGSRDAKEIKKYTLEIVDFLMQHDAKLMIIACNSATAVAIDDIRAKVNIPVIGVIQPGARAALNNTKLGCIGVIGTEATIESKAYEKALVELNPHIEVISEACPLFVPLVESGEYLLKNYYLTIHQSISHLRKYPIDCLIMGCTHYPFLSEAIAEVMGHSVKLINSAEETAIEAKRVLQQILKLETESVNMPKHRMYCSGNMALFKKAAEIWLADELQYVTISWQKV